MGEKFENHVVWSERFIVVEKMAAGFHFDGSNRYWHLLSSISDISFCEL